MKALGLSCQRQTIPTKSQDAPRSIASPARHFAHAELGDQIERSAECDLGEFRDHVGGHDGTGEE